MRTVAVVVAAPVFVLAGQASVYNAQVCGPCVALLGGAAAGYWVNRRLEAETSDRAMRQGARAGAWAGLGAFLGHTLGGLIGAAVLGPGTAAQQTAPWLRALGLPELPANPNPVTYYGGALFASCCFGLFDVAVMAGVGALAGMVWYQMGRRGQGQAPLPPTG